MAIPAPIPAPTLLKDCLTEDYSEGHSENGTNVLYQAPHNSWILFPRSASLIDHPLSALRQCRKAKHLITAGPGLHPPNIFQETAFAVIGDDVRSPRPGTDA